MMPATAAGTAGGRDKIGMIVLAGTIGHTIGWIENIIDFTIVPANRKTGVMREFNSACAGNIRGLTTETTNGLLTVK